VKPSGIIVIGSLALNVGFVGLIAAGLWEGRAQGPKAMRRSGADAAAARAKATPSTQTWAAFQAADLAGERDRLRAEGFPPGVIRAILENQIHQGSSARRKAIDASNADRPFWKEAKADFKAMGELVAIGRAESKELKDLLGPDPDNGTAASLRGEFPDLPADKIERLAAIRDHFNEQQQDLYSTNPRDLSVERSDKVKSLKQAMHAEIAAELTPQQLEDYDLRSSDTANSLQQSLSAFNPSEEEFRALYKLQDAFDDQNKYQPGMSPDQMRAREEAQKQLNAQIAEQLGPERYAEYERDTDYGYKQTSQLMERLDLPTQTANDLYALQKEFNQRRQDVYKNVSGPGSQDQVAQQLTALQQEAGTRITTLLGGNAAAVDAYKQYGGSWYTYLNPPTPLRRN